MLWSLAVRAWSSAWTEVNGSVHLLYITVCLLILATCMSHSSTTVGAQQTGLSPSCFDSFLKPIEVWKGRALPEQLESWFAPARSITSLKLPTYLAKIDVTQKRTVISWSFCCPTLRYYAEGHTFVCHRMPLLRTATNPTKMEYPMGCNFRGSKLLRMAAFHNIHSFYFHSCRSIIYYIICMHYISVLIQTMIRLACHILKRWDSSTVSQSIVKHWQHSSLLICHASPLLLLQRTYLSLFQSFPLRNPYLRYLNTHRLAVEPPSPSVVCFTPAVKYE